MQGEFFLAFLNKSRTPGSADTHEHFHELRAGNMEERHIGFAGYGAGQQGLTNTGRTKE